MADLQDIYKDLEKALQKVDDFLTAENVAALKSVFKPIDKVVDGRLTMLVDRLIELLTKIMAEVEKIKFAPEVTDKLEKVSEFTDAAKAVLEASKILLANDAASVAKIDEALTAVNIAGALPTVGDVKATINELITKIIAELKDIKK